MPEEPMRRLGDEAGALLPAGAPDAGRGPDGRFQAGNTAALVVGGRSAAFWRAQAAARRELEAELIADAGFTPDDAPAALKLAVESLSQAMLIQRSAFERIGEAGGPLTIKGRGRRAFLVWLQAFDRVEQALRLVGLKRKSKPINPLDAVRQAVIEANNKRSQSQEDIT